MGWTLIGNIRGPSGGGGDSTLIGEIIGLALNAPVPSENFVRCDGGFVNDARSPMDGEPIPNLNLQNRFLRGSDVAGGIGGQETHSHFVLGIPEGAADTGNPGGGQQSFLRNPGGNISTDIRNHLPPYYNTIFWMRIW